MGFKSDAADDGTQKTSFAFNIRTDIELGQKIHNEAKRRGESSSFVFREAVREYSARKDKLLKAAEPD